MENLPVVKGSCLHDRVLVKADVPQTISQGGIILPGAEKNKEARGVVIDVGPGAFNPSGLRNAMSVKRGDRVIFSKYSGTEIKLDGVTYNCIRDDDIFMVMQEEPVSG